jgi:CDP-glycerol glycerophosphotransferase (TagB/SpsB family)
MNKAINGIKYWGQLICLPVYWLSFCVPKRKDIWLFGSTFGRRFADNPRYLYLYANQHKNEIIADEKTKKTVNPIWISHKKDIVEFLNEQGYEAYYYHSLKGIWYCLRAKIYIFDNYSKDISFWLSGGAIKFNLWHGSGNKKTNYDNKFDTVRHPKNAWEKFKTFPRRLSDEKPHHYTLATGPMMAKIFTSAFHTDLSHIIQDGYPRNDRMFDTDWENLLLPEEERNLQQIQEIKKQGQKVLIYMPTFRASENLFFKAMHLEKFNEFLGKNNLHFFTKLHPKSKLKEQFAQVRYSHISNIGADVDPYTFMKECDLLVTDYSSIYSDYLMLNRPSVLFPYDFEEYSKDTRECYFEYDEYMPEIKAYTMDELMTDIEQVLKQDDYEQGRLELRDKIFQYADGEASRRLCEKVVKLVNE